MEPEDDFELNYVVDGVVHTLSTEFTTYTVCGLKGLATEDVKSYTLDAVNCVLCLTEVQEDLYFRCTCSWVGGDPDYWRGQQTCPACWKHDKKRVPVTCYVR